MKGREVVAFIPCSRVRDSNLEDKMSLESAVELMKLNNMSEVMGGGGAKVILPLGVWAAANAIKMKVTVARNDVFGNICSQLL